MKNSQELKLAWSSIKSERIPKAEKIPKVKEIRGGVRAIELAAVRDMGFSFHEVHKARELLVELDRWLVAAGVDPEAA